MIIISVDHIHVHFAPSWNFHYFIIQIRPRRFGPNTRKKIISLRFVFVFRSSHGNKFLRQNAPVSGHRKYSVFFTLILSGLNYDALRTSHDLVSHFFLLIFEYFLLSSVFEGPEFWRAQWEKGRKTFGNFLAVGETMELDGVRREMKFWCPGFDCVYLLWIFSLKSVGRLQNCLWILIFNPLVLDR